MISKLCITCVCGHSLEAPFERVVEVPADTTLGRLHELIQQLAGFDSDHMFTFFIARGPGGKKTEVVDAYESKERLMRLYDTSLDTVFPLPQNMRLFYHFDFGDNWIFQIGMRGSAKPAVLGAKYPQVVKKVGPKPRQYPDCGE